MLVLGFLAMAALAAGTVTPTAPGPGASFNAGSPCPMQFTSDPTGTWTNMTISLMSGSNLAMNVVTTVASGLDGTKLSSYTWTCPAVTPYSAIYFYQFTHDGLLDPTWTTRFTIADATGKSTAPQFATQPGGQAIPYGIGKLAGNAVVVSSGAALPATASSAVVASSSVVLAPLPISSSAAVVTVAPTSAAAVTTSAASSSAPTVVPASSTTAASTSASAAATVAAKVASGDKVKLGASVLALGAILFA